MAFIRAVRGGDVITRASSVDDLRGYISDAGLSDRKLRLFVCAVCRMSFRDLSAACLDAIEVAEKVADRTLAIVELGNTRVRFIRLATDDIPTPLYHDLSDSLAYYPKSAVLRCLTELRSLADDEYAPLFLDIFGPSPKSISTARLPPDALAIASAAYEYRLEDGSLDPDRLNVLSDRLIECDAEQWECWECDGTGKNCIPFGPDIPCFVCDGEPMIGNRMIVALRENRKRFRGFWPLDLLLGRE